MVCIGPTWWCEFERSMCGKRAVAVKPGGGRGPKLEKIYPVAGSAGIRAGIRTYTKNSAVVWIVLDYTPEATAHPTHQMLGTHLRPTTQRCFQLTKKAFARRTEVNCA
jgi:hypothetical protein